MTEALLIGLIAGMGGLLLGGMIAGSWWMIGLALAFFGALVWIVEHGNGQEA